MIKMNSKLLSIAAAAAISLSSATAIAAEMKPFILGSVGSGDMASKIDEVKKSLTSNGFQVVGEYTPYENAHVVVATNDDMKKAAASHDRGGYFAGERVGITKVGDEIQVSYTNPKYMAAAYHIKSNVDGITKALATALGSKQEFGPDKGLSADDIDGYHYTFGMEYFDEPYSLADYDSHKAAVDAVEKGLAAHKGGTTKVYRIDIPGGKQTVFGVGMSSEKTDNKYMDDAFIMSEIDFKKLRSTAHLPYEILVTGDEVEALHARFRIAIDFPDLSMMGANSFMNIMPTPDAIKAALTEAAGGKLKEDF